MQMAVNVRGTFVVILMNEQPASIIQVQTHFMSFAEEIGTGQFILLDPRPEENLESLIYTIHPKGIVVYSTSTFCANATYSDGEIIHRVLNPYYFVRFEKKSYIFGTWTDRYGVYHNDGPDLKMYELINKIKPKGRFRGTQDHKCVAEMDSEIVKNTFKWEPSGSVAQEDLYMFLRKAPRVPFTLVVLLPFEGKLWATLAASIVILALAWLVLRTVTHAYAHHARSTSVSPYARPFSGGAALAAALDIAKMLVPGECAFTTLRGPERVAAISVIAVGMVLCSAYSGLLLGFLTVPVYYPDANTINDATDAVDEIYLSRDVYNSIYCDRRDKNEKFSKKFFFFRYIDEIETKFGAIAAGNRSAIVTSQLTFISLIGNIENKHGSIHVVRERLFSPVHRTYKVKRNHYFTERFKSIVQRVVQGGLYDHWMSAQRHLQTLDGQMQLEPESGPQELAVKQLGGPFLLLSGGLAVSLVAFLWELWIGRDPIVVCARVLRLLCAQAVSSVGALSLWVCAALRSCFCRR